MKCWRCGADGDESVVKCPSCGADLMRKEPASEIGKAMRMLYDRYGAEKILTNSAYLVNGLGDLTEDSKKVRNQMKMAMDAGMGKAYLEQIALGAPDASFDSRVRMLLTDEAGLSDKVSAELAGYFDEMIGWKSVPGGQTAKAQETNKEQEIDRKNLKKEDFGPEIDRKKPIDDYGKEIDRKKPKADLNGKPKKRGGRIFLFAALFVVVIGIIISLGQRKNDQSEKQERAEHSTTIDDAEEAARKAEEAREAEEARKAAEEQDNLKARFEAMRDYRGDLVEDDFISYYEPSNHYDSMYFKGSAFGPTEGFVFARGLRSGDSRETVRELYGDPNMDFYISEGSYLYKIHIFEMDEEGAADILGAEVYQYELETEEITYRIGFRFDKESDEVVEHYVLNTENKEDS